MGSIRVRDAEKRRDGHALLQFRCWMGDEDPPAGEEFDPSAGEESDWWVRDVEEYVRLLALKYAQHAAVAAG